MIGRCHPCCQTGTGGNEGKGAEKRFVAHDHQRDRRCGGCMATREAPVITGPGPRSTNAVTCRTGDTRCQAARGEGTQTGGT